jgi:hypothetical protein
MKEICLFLPPHNVLVDDFFLYVVLSELGSPTMICIILELLYGKVFFLSWSSICNLTSTSVVLASCRHRHLVGACIAKSIASFDII